MQLDGCEVSALDDPLFPKETYLKLKYNQHLIPLYQLAGNNSVNLRAGLTTLAVEARKRGESTVMSDFPGLPSNLSLFKTTQQIAKEQWWREVQKQVAHTCLIIRDKKYTRIPSNELVLGDIVFVSAGDIVGADLRVIVCSPNSLMDISSITGLSNDFKELQEKPTDLNPLKSKNVAPAHCPLVDGLFFGIVIKTGEETLYASHQKPQTPPPVTFSLINPFFLSNGDALVKQLCLKEFYPMNVERLQSLRKLDYFVLSIPYACEAFNQETVNQLVQQRIRIVFCREMDICYDKDMWKPPDGYVNVSCKNKDTIETVIAQFVKSEEPILGLTVHPSQYYWICKLLKGEKQSVLFLGGSSFENATAMDVANVSIVYNSAKDLCKLKSHGILLRNSLQLIANVLEPNVP
ncbi:hypothetical protein WA588_001545 [Blastocystis sp. NMH]